MGYKRHVAVAAAITAATLACVGTSAAQPHRGRGPTYVGVRRAAVQCDHSVKVYYTEATAEGKQWETVQPFDAVTAQTETSDGVWHSVGTNSDGMIQVQPHAGWPMFRWRVVLADGTTSAPVVTEQEAGCGVVG